MSRRQLVLEPPLFDGKSLWFNLLLASGRAAMAAHPATIYNLAPRDLAFEQIGAGEGGALTTATYGPRAGTEPVVRHWPEPPAWPIAGFMTRYPKAAGTYQAVYNASFTVPAGGRVVIETAMPEGGTDARFRLVVPEEPEEDGSAQAGDARLRYTVADGRATLGWQGGKESGLEMVTGDQLARTVDALVKQSAPPPARPGWVAAASQDIGPWHEGTSRWESMGFLRETGMGPRAASQAGRP